MSFNINIIESDFSGECLNGSFQEVPFELIQKARTKGISLCIDDSKKLADSLDEAGKKLSGNPYLDKLLRILSTRCMSPAQYFCSGEYQAKDFFLNISDFSHLFEQLHFGFLFVGGFWDCLDV